MNGAEVNEANPAGSVASDAVFSNPVVYSASYAEHHVVGAVGDDFTVRDDFFGGGTVDNEDAAGNEVGLTTGDHTVGVNSPGGELFNSYS